MKKIYSVKIDFIQTRLDRWIRKNVFDVPQSLIEKNIRKGNIKINNMRVKSSYKLQKNDQIILCLFEIKLILLMVISSFILSL